MLKMTKNDERLEGLMFARLTKASRMSTKAFGELLHIEWDASERVREMFTTRDGFERWVVAELSSRGVDVR